MKYRLLSLIAILGFSTCVSAQIPSYIPKDSLVGWWPFNGNANDESGNGNNGTVNGATLTTDRFGDTNKAYNFDGVNDNILTQTNCVTDSSNRTISVWIFSNNSSTNTDRVIIDEGGTECGSGFALLQNYLNNPIFDNTCSRKLFNQNFNLNVWNHLVILFDNSLSVNLSSIKCYLNNVEIVESNFSGEYNINSGNTVPFTIGSSRLLNEQYFLGKIDDLGIWNRALTEEEITSLYYGSSLVINDVSQSNLFSVYPNPAQSVITVNTDAKLVGSLFAIYDNTGKVVKRGNIKSENTNIELGNLSGGIYVFSIGENMKQTFKVLKE
jgi:hypothetical protein